MGLGLGEGQGLSVEEDPTLLHVSVNRQVSTEPGAAAIPTAVAEHPKLGDSCSDDECSTAREQSSKSGFVRCPKPGRVNLDFVVLFCSCSVDARCF